METDKKILDVCCGNRLFWFNKNNPDTLFIDKRIREKGFVKNRPNREIKPDILMDFTDLKFKDNSFNLVVMDPPHIFSNGENYDMVKIYGYLNKNTWKDEIKKGFDESMRVLKPNGILIFKWNEASVKKKELLSVLGVDPLFGHPNGSKIPTHWLCFMKITKIEDKRE